MPFGDLITNEDLLTGTIDHKTLLARCFEKFPDHGAAKREIIFVKLAVENKYFDIAVSLDYEQPELSTISWRFVAYFGEVPPNASVDFRLRATPLCDPAPLTWRLLVNKLCEAFSLETKIVWSTAVDLIAFDTARARQPHLDTEHGAKLNYTLYNLYVKSPSLA